MTPPWGWPDPWFYVSALACAGVIATPIVAAMAYFLGVLN